MKLFLMVFAVLVVALPAAAESAHSGLSYTTIGHKDREQEQRDSGKKFLHVKRIAPVPDLEQEDEQKEARQAPFTRIWEKYKGLAAGTEEESDSFQGKKPEQKLPEAAQNAKTTDEQESGTAPIGLQGILANYYKNKEKRGQMKTRVITPPPENAKTPEQQTQTK